MEFSQNRDEVDELTQSGETCRYQVGKQRFVGEEEHQKDKMVRKRENSQEAREKQKKKREAEGGMGKMSRGKRERKQK